jgi:hypothetical protein
MTMDYAISELKALKNERANNFLHKMRFDLTQERYEQYCKDCALVPNNEISLVQYLNVLLSIFEYYERRGK